MFSEPLMAFRVRVRVRVRCFIITLGLGLRESGIFFRDRSLGFGLGLGPAGSTQLRNCSTNLQTAIIRAGAFMLALMSPLYCGHSMHALCSYEPTVLWA